MDYTQNLNLPQFEATDRIHHDDFNDAFDKIDALGGQRIEIGSYIGDGTASRTITLSHTPKLLFISGWMSDNRPLGTFVFGTHGHSFQFENSLVATDGIALVENGFTVGTRHNISGKSEYYVAIY